VPVEQTAGGTTTGEKEKGSKTLERPSISRKQSEMKSAFQTQRYCVYIMCEHEEVHAQ